MAGVDCDCMGSIDQAIHRGFLMLFRQSNHGSSSTEESLGLQKQADRQQWAEPGDQQGDFHPQG